MAEMNENIIPVYQDEDDFEEFDLDEIELSESEIVRAEQEHKQGWDDDWDDTKYLTESDFAAQLRAELSK